MVSAFGFLFALAVTPLEFVCLIWAALIGCFLFDELPDMFIRIGGAMIVVSVC